MRDMLRRGVILLQPPPKVRTAPARRSAPRIAPHARPQAPASALELFDGLRDQIDRLAGGAGAPPAGEVRFSRRARPTGRARDSVDVAAVTLAVLSGRPVEELVTRIAVSPAPVARAAPPAPNAMEAIDVDEDKLSVEDSNPPPAPDAEHERQPAPAAARGPAHAAREGPPARNAVPAAAPVSDEWACHVCTYLNPRSAAMCGMCEAARPVAPAPAPAAAVAPPQPKQPRPPQPDVAAAPAQPSLPKPAQAVAPAPSRSASGSQRAAKRDRSAEEAVAEPAAPSAVEGEPSLALAWHGVAHVACRAVCRDRP
jgi:hypothetical protein